MKPGKEREGFWGWEVRRLLMQHACYRQRQAQRFAERFQVFISVKPSVHNYTILNTSVEISLDFSMIFEAGKK